MKGGRLEEGTCGCGTFIRPGASQVHKEAADVGLRGASLFRKACLRTKNCHRPECRFGTAGQRRLTIVDSLMPYKGGECLLASTLSYIAPDAGKYLELQGADDCAKLVSVNEHSD